MIHNQPPRLPILLIISKKNYDMRVHFMYNNVHVRFTLFIVFIDANKM